MAVVLTIVSGNNTVAAAGESFQIVVNATDGGLPVEGITIGWPVLTGDATTSTDPFSDTDVDGNAVMSVTSGNGTSTIGPYAPALPSTITFTVYGQTNFNCACDDAFPTKSLLEMRTWLATRLGMGAQTGNLPPGMAAELDSFLVDAQEQIFMQLKLNRMERFFTWQLEPGVRFYDFSANLYECTKKLNPDMITWVGISQDGNFWRRLVSGINPAMYYSDIAGWPQYYEFRQCIEIWPPPQDDTWQLRIKGYFGLMPLSGDGDTNTIDYQLIQLFALANAKAHRGQPDAANYMQQYRSYLGKVVAGQHGLTRYVPGADETAPPPLPVFTGYSGDP